MAWLSPASGCWLPATLDTHRPSTLRLIPTTAWISAPSLHLCCVPTASLCCLLRFLAGARGGGAASLSWWLITCRFALPLHAISNLQMALFTSQHESGHNGWLLFFTLQLPAPHENRDNSHPYHVVKIISVHLKIRQLTLFTCDPKKGILAAQVWSGKVPGSATATISPTASRTHVKARTRMQTAWAQLQCFFSNNLPWGNAAVLRDARRRVS